jgi:hypothetical protein
MEERVIRKGQSADTVVMRVEVFRVGNQCSIFWMHCLQHDATPLFRLLIDRPDFDLAKQSVLFWLKNPDAVVETPVYFPSMEEFEDYIGSRSEAKLQHYWQDWKKRIEEILRIAVGE